MAMRRAAECNANHSGGANLKLLDHGVDLVRRHAVGLKRAKKGGFKYQAERNDHWKGENGRRGLAGMRVQANKAHSSTHPASQTRILMDQAWQSTASELFARPES